MAINVGKLRKVPPPAIPFDIPAAIPATQKMTRRHPRGSEAATIGEFYKGKSRPIRYQSTIGRRWPRRQSIGEGVHFARYH
jgi:hypothetical protein